MEILRLDRKRYISTRDARTIMNNCSNTTIFNQINHFKAFDTRKVGTGVMVEVTSFKKFCKEKGYDAGVLQ
jgi:hypothetical protein